ncbi:alpha-ketoglutarate dehydrogenase component 4-like [Elephas maximus indicus]|uniref:alpha-ketoglutarate dehydrogenase component 4-like n=1 Tax=Elephas maximus indicus TaxID=99487 RepID=UPI002116FF8C|nr:alpha-ketoglutarate dehydrogenase component 4-like [Elephas maximus indicus]
MTSSKMLSTSRTVQVVKPHTPLIRFPDRRDNPKPTASEALRSGGIASHSSAMSQHSKGCKSPDLLMHQGSPDTAEIMKTLPQKFKRKLVSQEEIKMISRGGRIITDNVAAVCHQTKKIIFTIKDFQNDK